MVMLVLCCEISSQMLKRDLICDPTHVEGWIWALEVCGACTERTTLPVLSHILCTFQMQNFPFGSYLWI
jgi:hypothetical protein